LLLENSFFFSNSWAPSGMPSWWIWLAYNAEQTVYFVLASFVTVDTNTEEKGLFITEVPGMSLSTSYHYFDFFVTARSPLRSVRGHSTPCQDNQPACAHTSEGGAEPLQCWQNFWSCSVESRAAKVGHDMSPRTLSNVRYDIGHDSFFCDYCFQQ
jgi:hypothetical protein